LVWFCWSEIKHEGSWDYHLSHAIFHPLNPNQTDRFLTATRMRIWFCVCLFTLNHSLLKRLNWGNFPDPLANLEGIDVLKSCRRINFWLWTYKEICTCLVIYRKNVCFYLYDFFQPILQNNVFSSVGYSFGQAGRFFRLCWHSWCRPFWGRSLFVP